MSADPNNPALLIFIWEFRVHLKIYSAFEQAYGPDGDWAKLFRRGEGYMRTELHRDPSSPGRYFTLDFWQSRQAFDHFKRTHAAEYAALDAQCESLTEEEAFIGECATPEQARTLLSSKGLRLATTSAYIRAATPADIPQLVSLEQATPSAAHWDSKTYEQMFAATAVQRIVLVAELDGIACGFTAARIGPGECELENIVVAQAHRRAGTGRKLLRALIAAACEKSAARLLLEVRESNHPARRLYESCGFTLSGRRKGYYSSPPEDALGYTLSL